ncbi:hypothetical protein C7N83_05825 [Neisseria iguanae]|uniref:Uncharacterized protein n=1 Tax=Neisseria iguanae TaxID=90242 RepID=A0A2P7U0K3_9NEIS|nr:hypothetical protein C7N83_05825 [Neisseria iguanae]
MVGHGFLYFRDNNRNFNANFVEKSGKAESFAKMGKPGKRPSEKLAVFQTALFPYREPIAAVSPSALSRQAEKAEVIGWKISLFCFKALTLFRRPA